jgi:hypothetical protein
MNLVKVKLDEASTAKKNMNGTRMSQISGPIQGKNLFGVPNS